MNFLAHAYLSFNDPETLVGNMISDFVKGKKKFEYSPAILKGIHLHREIDQFTDEHPATRYAGSFFKEAYHRYGAAFADVVYDHFLANDDTLFPENELQEFTQQVYAQLEPFLPNFPSPFNQMFPYMKQQNWLYNYKFEQGIYNSFGGLVRRAAYMHEVEPAKLIFKTHYKELNNAYQAFFPDLLAFARQRFLNF